MNTVQTTAAKMEHLLRLGIAETIYHELYKKHIEINPNTDEYDFVTRWLQVFRKRFARSEDYTFDIRLDSVPSTLEHFVHLLTIKTVEKLEDDKFYTFPELVDFFRMRKYQLKLEKDATFTLSNSPDKFTLLKSWKDAFVDSQERDFVYVPLLPQTKPKHSHTQTTNKPHQAVLALYIYYLQEADCIPNVRNFDGTVKERLTIFATAYELSPNNLYGTFYKISKRSIRVAANQIKNIQQAIKMLEKFPEAKALAEKDLHAAMLLK